MKEGPPITVVNVCGWIDCKPKGSEQVFSALQVGLADTPGVTVRRSSCLNQCDKGPNVEVVEVFRGSAHPFDKTVFNRVGRKILGIKIGKSINELIVLVKKRAGA